MLLAEAMKNKLTFDSEQKQQLRAKAQMTEILYNVFKDEGISARIDEDIGIDFINFEELPR